MTEDPFRDGAVRSFLDQVGRATETTGVRLDPNEGALYYHGTLVGYLDRHGPVYDVSPTPAGHLVTREPHRAARPRASTATRPAETN